MNILNLLNIMNIMNILNILKIMNIMNIMNILNIVAVQHCQDPHNKYIYSNDDEYCSHVASLGKGARALSVTLSGGALFAS